MLKIKRLICSIVLSTIVLSTVTPYTYTRAEDSNITTAVTNIDKYDKLLDALHLVSRNSLEFEDRCFELKLLNNIMMLSGYMYAYNENIKSTNSTETEGTNTDISSFEDDFNNHLKLVISALSTKNDDIVEKDDESNPLYKSLFTNKSLDVYLEEIKEDKNKPLIHAKLLAEGLLVEEDNRLRSMLSIIASAGELEAGNVISLNKEFIKGTLQAYRDTYNNAKLLYGLGVQVFDSSKMDEYNRSYIEIYSAYEELAYKYNISLSLETLTSEDIVNVNASDLIDLVASFETGNENKLSNTYLALFSQSALFMPFVSKINSINSAEYISSTYKDKLQRPFGNRRKPLYLMDVDDQVEDYLDDGGTPNKARIATLTDIVNDAYDIDIALFLKRDSEASSISSLGLEGNAELTKEQRDKIENYRLPGLSKDFTDAVYLAKASKVKGDNAIQYMRANTNYILLNNSIKNYKDSKEVTADLASPVYMDIYGNIVTESGFVVVPAASNAVFYDKPILPLNASLFLNYPVFGSSGSELIQNRSEDKGKFILSTPSYFVGDISAPVTFSMYKSDNNTVDYTGYATQSALDTATINKNGALSKTSWNTMYIFPFTPYIWHKGIDDPYRVLDEPVANVDVYINGVYRSIVPYVDIFNLGADDKMSLIPISDKVIVSGDGAGYDLANLLTSTQVQEAIYQQNFHYFTSDQWSDSHTGKAVGYSNGVLRDSLMIDIAQEVARGSDIGKVMVGDIDSATLLQNSIKSRGIGGIITATIAGFGEDIHRLFHTGMKNIVTYVPNLSELPIMQTVVLNIVPIFVTGVVIIFFILIILTFISKRNTVKELVVKLMILLYIISFLVVICPAVITTGFNSITNITSTNIAYSILVEEENEDKGVSTLAFDSFNENSSLTVSSPDILHAKLSQEDIDKQLEAAGIQLTQSQNKIKKYLFSDDREFTSLDANNIIYIRGNNLVTPIKDLYNSSRITFKQVTKAHPVANINVISYQLFQDWTNDPKPHYFMPYYMIIDNLIYNINEIAENTYTVPLIKKYQEESKTTNLASTYFSSVLFTQPENYSNLQLELMLSKVNKKNPRTLTAEEKKSLEAYQETAKTTKDTLGDTNDFLGLFNILQLPGRNISAPFTNSNIDMEAVKRTDWSNNSYTDKLKTQTTNAIANNKKPIAIINGYMTSDKNPALFTDDEVYVPLSLLGEVGFHHSVSKDNILSVWGNGIRFENKIGTADYKIKYETSNEKAEKTIKGTPLTSSDGRVMFPMSMLTYWEGNVSRAKDNKTATTILKNFKKTGVYGDIIEKVYATNDSVRQFVTASKDYLTTVSDENILKTISLYASIKFADNFSTANHKLSPVGLSNGRVNYDTYLKSIFIPAGELTNSDTISIYYYIAFKYPSLVLFFALYQIVLLLFSITKVLFLYTSIAIFTFYALRYFLFKDKSDPTIFKAIFVLLGYIYASHALVFIGFKATTYAINSDTGNFLSSFGAALMLNIIVLAISTTILIFTMTNVKNNISTLGYDGLTSWMKDAVNFFKMDNKLKSLIGKISPNLLLHKEKLTPSENIRNSSVVNEDHLEKVIDKNEVVNKTSTIEYTALNSEPTESIDLKSSDSLKLQDVNIGSLGDLKIGSGKLVSVDEFDKEVKENPDLLKNNKFIQIQDTVVDVNNALKAEGETKNIVRINAPNTAKLTKTLSNHNVIHETHGGSIVALVNDNELAKVEASYKEDIQDNSYSKVSLAKIKGDIANSNIKETLKERGITDYATYDKSIVMTKENADKVSDVIQSAKLQVESTTGLKATDKESFVNLQKNISKKVLLNNNILYSVETENIPKSTGKVFVKDAYTFEVNPLCSKSATTMLDENKLKYTVKGKVITLHDTPLTDNLINALDKSLSLDNVEMAVSNGVNSVKNILK